jgi:hypothetical protein
VVLLAMTALGGCGSSPQSLGITGPGPAPAQASSPDESAVPPPGISNMGNSYRYNFGPEVSGDRYFNYN